MKPSYLLGLLLILSTAISNRAMAQRFQTEQSLESITPPSIKAQLNKRHVSISRPNGRLAASSVRSMQFGNMQRQTMKPIDDRILQLLIARRNNPSVKPTPQGLAQVQRRSFAPQSFVSQGRQIDVSKLQSNQSKAAFDADKEKFLQRLKKRR